MRKLKEGNVVLGAHMLSKTPPGIVYYAAKENNEFVNMLGYYTSDLEKALIFSTLQYAITYIVHLPTANGMLTAIPMRVKASTRFVTEEIK